MFEKVNPCHPDKVADRIAGAIVDLAYSIDRTPQISADVMIGHKVVNIIVETSLTQELTSAAIKQLLSRRLGMRLANYDINVSIVGQDPALKNIQEKGIVCADSGIYPIKGVLLEERLVTELVGHLYGIAHHDGKAVYDIVGHKLSINQSNMSKLPNDYMFSSFLKHQMGIDVHDIAFNPLGFWIGGTDANTGVSNRQRLSDEGYGIVSGGLHGKDLSKPDVTLPIFSCLHCTSDEFVSPIICNIGDDFVTLGNGKTFPYSECVDEANDYIKTLGGFEKLAEWGLLRPSRNYN